MSDGVRQVVAGLLFKTAARGGRRVDRFTFEETQQHGAALGGIDIRRDPCVLGPDLPFVLREARRGSAQDGQVDVGQQGRVRRAGKGAVAGGHDQVVDTVAGLPVESRGAQGRERPLGRACFVVVRANVVDGVVEPQRQLDLVQALRLILEGIGKRQAFAKVLLRVIVALRLAVGVQQRLAQA